MSSFGSAEPPVIVIDCSLPVPRSLAETCTMPLASMSKVTSICGTPRGAGGRPVSSNMPSFLLYAAISRSPWKTWICTDGWLSSAVVKISERLVGIVVLRSISLVMMPPLVSMPRRQRGDVEQQDVLDLALEHAGLQRGTDRDDLVGVDALVRLLAAGQLADQVDDGGHPGGATDQDDVVDLADVDAGVLDDLLERRLASGRAGRRSSAGTARG